MGSYGIGLGRLMGTIVEILSDEKGLVWPVAIAPFKVHIVEISSSNEKVKETSEKIYNLFRDNNLEVLYDDREVRAGEKFNDSDLMGIPLRIVVSEKGIEKGEFEIKQRKDGEVLNIKEKDLLKFVEEYK
jgi:prolyl-tRNA synthetase